MATYYNEFDPYAAQWLRNLIAAGHIAQGEVDERSICDVDPADLAGFTQCHFFAGIGVWSYALRLASWPDDRPVWTGSCPCQPFSAAGKGRGFDDERHLWPEFFRLIRERRPAIVFGEQVASKDGLEWLDLVQADLEGAGYASAAADICAAGVGAPHIRQRLWWMADASGQRQRADQFGRDCGDRIILAGPEPRRNGSDDGGLGWMADGSGARLEGRDEGPLGRERASTERGDRAGRMADSARLRHGEHQRDTGAMAGTRGRDESQEPQLGRLAQAAGDCGEDGGMADTDNEQRGELGHSIPGNSGEGSRAEGMGEYPGPDGMGCGPRPTNGHWRDADWLYCRDGKWRPVEPGTFPLAHGAPARVGRLRAYGNAIVPQVAQAFIEAVMEVRP